MHTDGKQVSLLAAVSAPHAALGEGRPSSRWQQQGRAGLVLSVTAVFFNSNVNIAEREAYVVLLAPQSLYM